MLDTSYDVEIPGGITIETQLAGPVSRFLASLIDLILRGVLLMIAGFASLFLGELGTGLWLIIWFLIEWFYPVLFEVFNHGQTPGKKALGLSVVQDDLTPITFGPSLIRNLLRVADFLPLCYLLGLVTMVCNRRFQRLGDLAAGTLVVSIRKTTRPTHVADVAPMAPSISLLRSEQTAITNFLQRNQQLSRPRQQELACILDNITHDPDDKRVEKLHRMGAWFLGMR